MNNSRRKMNPGARIFGHALASIKVPSSQPNVKLVDYKVTQKESSWRPVTITETSVPVSSLMYKEPYSSPIISEVAANEDEYGLPVTTPGAYMSSDVYSSFSFSSATRQFGSSTITCRTPAENSVYAFRLRPVPLWLPTDVFPDPDTFSRTSDEYRLPLTNPQSAPDSGYPSSEDGSVSGASSPDYNVAESMAYYHVINSSESPLENHQIASSLARVNRPVLPCIQGKRTSTLTGPQISKSLSFAIKDLPFPAYTSVEDSGTEVSSDEDASLEGCPTCEKESEQLRKDNSRNQCGSLPDYSHLGFLQFKSDVGFIDSHCHLDFLFDRQNYDGTYADYMRRHRDTYPATYEGCVAVFCNPRTFHKKTMWQRYLDENGVWGAFGCHPKNANLYSDLIDSDLCSALNHPKVRALGEIGLDYSSRNGCSKITQHKVFRRQLKIALARKLPLVIHCRDAMEDCMAIMKEILPRDHTIHLHCFTDTWDWAQMWLSEFPNLFIGLTNLVTYESARPTHLVAKRIPLDRLLLETDAPYFVPRKSPRSTKWSHPGMAIHVASQIATLRNLPLREIIHRTRQNTRKMYGM